tara:strand:+ start:6905 stop:7198 length:294 start_codon:yes stop_codon:yes gene_type:complete
MIVSFDENQSIVLIRFDEEKNKVVVTINNNFTSDYPDYKVDQVMDVLSGLLELVDRKMEQQDILSFEPDPELLEKIEEKQKEDEKGAKVIHFTRRKQ